MNASKTLPVAIFLWCSCLAACGGQLYKVAPKPISTPPEISTDNPNGLNIGATIFGGDRSLEQFEANLPMAGVLAIDIQLSNRSTAAIDASGLQFELSDGHGIRFKAIPPKKALSKVMKWNGDRFYTLEARRRTRESYEAIGLNIADRLAAREERRGFLFFENPSRSSNLKGLSLSVKGAAMPMTLELNMH
ncbi:MAG TPA: hypothetical protein VJ302_00460 [Blastocatellia bacterium]|nr:hypothetical protein [Blastocatellia bacterium]